MKLFQNVGYFLLVMLVLGLGLASYIYTIVFDMTVYGDKLPLMTALVIFVFVLALVYQLYHQWGDNPRDNAQGSLELAGRLAKTGVLTILWGAASWLVVIVFQPQIFPELPRLDMAHVTYWLDRAMILPWLLFWLAASLLLHSKAHFVSAIISAALLLFSLGNVSRSLDFQNLFVHQFIENGAASTFSPFPALQVALWLVLVLLVSVIVITIMIALFQGLLGFLQDVQKGVTIGEPSTHRDSVEPVSTMSIWGVFGWYVVLLGLTALAVLGFTSYFPIEINPVPTTSLLSELPLLSGAILFATLVILTNIIGLFQLGWKVTTTDLFRINTLFSAMPLLWCGASILYFFITDKGVFAYEGMGSLTSEHKQVSLAVVTMLGFSALFISLSMFIKEKIHFLVAILSTIIFAVFVVLFAMGFKFFVFHSLGNMLSEKTLPFTPRMMFLTGLLSSLALWFWGISLIKYWVQTYQQFHVEKTSIETVRRYGKSYFTALLARPEVTYWSILLVVLPCLYLVASNLGGRLQPDIIFSFLWFSVYALTLLALNSIYAMGQYLNEPELETEQKGYGILAINAVFCGLPFLVMAIASALVVAWGTLTPSSHSIDIADFLIISLMGGMTLLWFWLARRLHREPTGSFMLGTGVMAFVCFLVANKIMAMTRFGSWRFPDIWTAYSWLALLIFIASLVMVYLLRNQTEIKALRAQLAQGK